MTLYDLLANRYLYGIVFLEFNSMNFSSVLKNKGHRVGVRPRKKNASPNRGGREISPIFYLTVTITVDVIAGL